ncbi:MAG: hypothetical protein ACP5H3_01565 [Candidatus Aenigmatarchaeota archaeon]
MNKSCIFCKIVKDELPSYKVYEDESQLAFLDILFTNKLASISYKKRIIRAIHLNCQIKFYQI